MLMLVAAVLIGAQTPALDALPSARTELVEERAGSNGVQARYDAALTLLLDGKLEEAAREFDALALAPVAASFTDRVRTLAEVSRALAARGQFVLKQPGIELPRPARVDRRGRGELAFFATTYGIWAGIATGAIVDVSDGREILSLAVAGGTTGLVLAIVPTRDVAMPEGRTQTIESAAGWGSLNGGLIAALAGADGRGVVGATLGAGLGAIGTSVLLTRERSPSSGDVALTNSGGIWGLVTGGLSLALLDHVSDTTAQGVLLAGADAGLLAMALVARRVDMSRDRSLLIDAGGLLGTLAGVSIPVFAETENGAAIGASGLAGMALGLGFATYLTRGSDEDLEEPTAARVGAATGMPVLARLEGGGFSAGVAGRF